MPLTEPRQAPPALLPAVAGGIVIAIALRDLRAGFVSALPVPITLLGTFALGGSGLSSSALAPNQAELSTSALSQGTHSITAVYSGDSLDNPSTSSPLTQVVNPQAPKLPASSTGPGRVCRFGWRRDARTCHRHRLPLRHAPGTARRVLR